MRPKRTFSEAQLGGTSELDLKKYRIDSDAAVEKHQQVLDLVKELILCGKGEEALGVLKCAN